MLFRSDTLFLTYKITALTIAGILNDATTFNTLIGSTKEDSNELSTANDSMDLVIIKLHADINSMDRTIKFLASDFPDFVSGYEKNKALPILGVKHEGLQGNVTKLGLPVQGAIIKVGNKKAISDAQGNYTMYHRPGKISVTITTASGETKTIIIEVFFRKMTTLNFEL